MNRQEIIELARTLPYSFEQVNDVHDKLPVKYQNKEYIIKAFNSGFAFAFADILSHSEYERTKNDLKEFIKNMPMPKPTIGSRIRGFFWSIKYNFFKLLPNHDR